MSKNVTFGEIIYCVIIIYMDNQNFLNKLNEGINYARTTENIVQEQGDDLEKLLRDNLRYSQAIFMDTQRIRRYMFWRMILNIVWFVLVLTPIILAFVYLPPTLRQAYGSYQQVVGETQGTFDLLNQLNKIR